VAPFGSDGKPTDEVIRNTLGLDPNSPAPTPDVTNEGVPLQDISSVGLYWLQIREQQGAQPDLIKKDAERQLIATNWWRPSTKDLEQIVGPHRSSISFASLLFSLSITPVGSIKTLSLVGYAPVNNYFSFNYPQVFDKDLSTWLPLEDAAADDIPFRSIRMPDLLQATAAETLPPLPDFPKVELSDVRNAFAANAQLRIFNVGNQFTEEFIQVIANFLQVQTVAFTDPIRVIAEEIDAVGTTPPALLKSYSFGFGFAIGEPPPAHTVQRLEDLLNEPSAYLAYPRRA